jgi:hypothetical protein
MNFIELILILYWSGVVVGQCNNKPLVRLVNGTRNGEGRLEVFGSGGQWSSVCPDNWVSRSAGVACEELCGDRRYATSLPASGRFGPVTNKIRIFDTKCVGSENSLVECPHVESNGRNCYEDTAVGLCCHSGCDGRNMFLAPRLRYAARCDYANYTVAVEYPLASPDGSVRPFQLYPYNKPDCWDQSTGANTTHNWITVNYTGDCGLSIENGDIVKFRQKVLIKGQSVGPSISRLFQFLLPVSCGLNRTSNQTIWLDTSAPNGILENLTEVNGSLKLDTVIKVYKDADFNQELGTPVKLPITTPLHVELSVDKTKLNGGGPAKIIVENCVAFPYLGYQSPNRPVIINDKLPFEDSTIIFRSPAYHKVQFKIQSFKIKDHKEVYLSCAIYVCPLSDNSPRCNDPAAKAQHMQNATLKADPTAPPSSGSSINVISPGYEVLVPELKNKPVYDHEDLPGLGPDDVVKIGKTDSKCYKVLPDDRIYFYRNPNLSSFATKTEDPILKQCLNQS